MKPTVLDQSNGAILYPVIGKYAPCVSAAKTRQWKTSKIYVTSIALFHHKLSDL
jgi:hypothetical protein